MTGVVAHRLGFVLFFQSCTQISHKQSTSIFIHFMQPANAIELDDLIADAKQKNQLVVIDFFHDNCPPCEKVAPLYEALSASDEFASVIFVKVKVEDHPVIANQYSVTGWPTFLFLKNGEVQTEIVGGKLAEATLYDWVKLLMPKKDDPPQEVGEEDIKEEKVVE